MKEKKRGSRSSPADAWQSLTGASDADSWLRTYPRVAQHHDNTLKALIFYRRIFDEAPFPLIVTTMDFLIVDANFAAQQLLGRDLRQLTGTPFSTSISRVDRDLFAGLSDLIRDKRRISRPVSIRAAMEKEIETSLIARAIPDDEGLPEFVLILLNDRSDSVTSDIL